MHPTKEESSRKIPEKTKNTVQTSSISLKSPNERVEKSNHDVIISILLIQH